MDQTELERRLSKTNEDSQKPEDEPVRNSWNEPVFVGRKLQGLLRKMHEKSVFDPHRVLYAS